MIHLTQRTYDEIDNEIANRMVAVRKRKKISQTMLAKRSGVSYGSIKRFEQTGEISLSALTRIAIALDAESEMDKLFSEVPFISIQEVINGES